MCKAAVWDFIVRNSGMRKAVTEVRVMHESRTVRDVSVMVVHHIVSVPIGSPVVPAPAEPAGDADPDSQAERDPWAIDIEAGNPDPPGIVR
jgi:hypothetical protein